MANLWTGSIDTDGDYESLATVTEQTLTSGTTYTIQVQNAAYIREGSDGDGFLVSNRVFTLTWGDDAFYIKTLSSNCIINISDTTNLKF